MTPIPEHLDQCSDQMRGLQDICVVRGDPSPPYLYRAFESEEREARCVGFVRRLESVFHFEGESLLPGEPAESDLAAAEVRLHVVTARRSTSGDGAEERDDGSDWLWIVLDSAKGDGRRVARAERPALRTLGMTSYKGDPVTDDEIVVLVRKSMEDVDVPDFPHPPEPRELGKEILDADSDALREKGRELAAEIAPELLSD